MSVTYTFSPNTKIQSSQVNQDFTDVSFPHLLSMEDVLTAEGTSSGTYADLATPGPSITYTPSVDALVFLIFSSSAQNSSAGQYNVVTPVISGATTLAADDNNCVLATSGSPNQVYAVTGIWKGTLSAGANTIKLQYRVSGGTGTFTRRRLILIPIGPA